MLADYQEALARLLVDAELRRVHALDGAALGEALGELSLDAGELASLRAISAAQLERVAGSLASKRRHAVEATVPACARLWPALGQRYLEFLAGAPARVEAFDAGLGPGASELLRALPRLHAAARTDPLAPPWTAELLTLELARACSRRDAQARSLRCRYPVHRALAALDEGWLSIDLEREACEYLVDAQRLRWRALELELGS